MADDNQTIVNNGVTIPFASRKITYSGDANQVAQAVGLLSFSGADDAKTAVDVPLPAALGANGGVKVDEVLDATDALVGATNESAPASDTATSGLNGRLQRIAQRISSIIALLPTALGAGGGFKVEEVATVSVTGFVVAAGTNPTVIASGARRLKFVHVFPIAQYPIFVKVHNTGSAPTAGSTAVAFRVGCQASLPRDCQPPGGGLSFGTGIAITVVKGIADADATPVLAGDAFIEVGWV